MKAFDNLLAEVRACTICSEFLPAGPRPVLQAAPGARILIAGQAPGRRVHVSGVPFDDASGDRLRNWLGLSRETFHDPDLVAILPMGFCYPGTGANGDLPPRPECASAWRSRLVQALPRLQLTLAIGAYAVAWHVPKRSAASLTEVVAQWRQFWPELVPMPHPSPRNNRWLKLNPWFESDLVPLLRERVDRILRSDVSAGGRASKLCGRLD